MKYSNHYLIWLFGVISGFNLMITSGALNFWLIKTGASLNVASFSSLISLPYALNFLWVTYLDQFSIKFFDKIFGKNLSWICSLQILSAIGILILATINPKYNLKTFFLVATILSFILSTHDSLIGSLRSKIIAPSEHGAFAGTYIFGYRIGMTISSFGAILISNYFDWSVIYKIFAVILIGICGLCYLARKKIVLRKEYQLTDKENKLPQNILGLFSNHINVRQILIILVFLCLYRLPDNCINIVINYFLINFNYNEIEIATYGKLLGIIAAIFGGFYASFLMKKISVIKGLVFFGIIHALAHGLFILQIQHQKSIFLISSLVFCESFTGGMAMASYIALITHLCYGKYRAAQYALYSSMMRISRSILPAASGSVVGLLGWNSFFISMSGLALVSLILIPLIKMPTSDEQPNR